MGTINLSIFVQDIGGVIQAYNTIRIRRSTTGTGGPWKELTAASPQPAVLTAPNPGAYPVVSKTLQLKVDNQPTQNIVFTGALDPLTAAEVAGQINVIFPGVASAAGMHLKLQSTILGTNSKLEIVGGGAAADFGWVAGTREIGREAYVALVAGQTLYNFVDKDGESSYYYQASYYNTANFLQSNWSEPFQGDAGTVIPAENLSKAYVDLADAQGVAVMGQKIRFYPSHDPSLQVANYGISLDRYPIEIETDNTGHAELSLVRGMRIRVAFEGTTLIREIIVPDEESFNLLDLMATAPDPYSVVIPDVPFAIRRSL